MRLTDADLLKEQMESVCMGIMAGTEPYNAPLKTIDDAPTVDAKPVVRGEWVKMSDRYGIYWACSECGEELLRISQYNPFDLLPRFKSVDRTNYCPHCGAMMNKGD